MIAKPLRVALCADFPEERWPSMDRVAATLLDGLRVNHAETIEVRAVVPPFARRAMRLSGRDTGPAYTVDRFLNRLWDYPRHVARLVADYDVFHIVDSSYAHLAHRLPASRTVVTCYDLDTFRSLLQPGEEPRSPLFKAMTRHVLSGLRRAARVTCATSAIRDEILSRQLLVPGRVSVVPLGVSPAFSSRPDPDADRAAAALLGLAPGATMLLHVGSTVGRKRIDVLLEIVGRLRAETPGLRLVRVGSPFTNDQRRLAQTLGLTETVVALDGVDDRTLAAVYRRAALVLLPSDREGFGFALVEAMACGTPVVASDLDVLREVGGAAAEYCPPGDAPQWVRRIVELLHVRRHDPDRWQARIDGGIAQARRFSWTRFAASLVQLYGEVAAEAGRLRAQSSS